MRHFFWILVLYPIWGLGQDCGEDYSCWRAQGKGFFEKRDYETAISCFKMALRAKNLPPQHDIYTWMENSRKFRMGQSSHLSKSLGLHARGIAEEEEHAMENEGLRQFIVGNYDKSWRFFYNTRSKSNISEVNTWMERALYGKNANILFANGQLDSAKYMYMRIKTPYENDFAEKQIDEIEHIWRTWAPVEEVRPDTLILDEMDLYSLPSELGNHTQLQKLDVHHNFLSSLPDKTAHLQGLRDLQLAQNNFQMIPHCVFSLGNLEVCNFSANQIQQISSNIGKLKKLKELDLSHNKIMLLPFGFGQLQSLSVLLLHNNQLDRFPGEVVQLQNLAVIDFSENQIHELPYNIGNLQSLQELDLSNNGYFTQIPESIGLLSELKELNIGGNIFHTPLPPSIGQLSKLEKLRLNDCQLLLLPDAIGSLKQLTHLDMENNLLSRLPAEIGRWQKMQILDISHNHLYELPREIGMLKQLQELNLSHNPLLQKLPVEIKSLKNLRELDLRGTGLSPIHLRQVKAWLPSRCVVLTDEGDKSG